MTPRHPTRYFAAALFLTLGACTVGPNYRTPGASVPQAIVAADTFKEAQGWAPAAPLDAIDKGAWWSAFADPELDRLERRVAITNQNVAAAEAAYRQARALVAQDRASLFPTLSASATASQTGAFTTRSTSSSSSNPTSILAGVSAGWAPDLWGRIRRTVEAARANAEVSAADLANATLLAQAELATDYFTLRLYDEQAQLLTSTVEAYQRTLQLTRNAYAAGTAAQADVISAQLQVENAQASLVDLAQSRAQREHAIAVLTGAPPSALTLAPGRLQTRIPVAPAGLPSTLLQRRPDIAASEREVKAANANIGVQISAYYPTLSLTGEAGSSANDLGRLFRAENAVWSVGSSLGETLIDFGARRAAVRGARAAYDQSVANYRAIVLTALQSVEDQLAVLRVLEQEQAVRARAEAFARRAEVLALNQYRAGTVSFTAVVTAQTQALSAEQATLAVTASRLNASVALIEALGGGWAVADLPQV